MRGAIGEEVVMDLKALIEEATGMANEIDGAPEDGGLTGGRGGGWDSCFVFVEVGCCSEEHFEESFPVKD